MTKVAAITMVYQDYWAIQQWYRHHGNMIGHENLYIFAHGTADNIRKICPKASVINVPREDLSWFDGKKGLALYGLQQAISSFYDWIINTDSDELVCLDPNRYSSFDDFISKNNGQNEFFAAGFDLVEVESDKPIPDGKNVFKFRKNAWFNGVYSKCCIGSSKNTHFSGHGLFVGNAKGYPYCMPSGLFMAHLKHANRKELDASNKIRKEMTSFSGGERLAFDWVKLKEEDVASKFLNDFMKLDEGRFDEAYKRLLKRAEGSVERGSVFNGQVITGFFRVQLRTKLPSWFEGV